MVFDGGFSKPIFISVDEPYKQKKAFDGPHQDKGAPRGFLTNPPKRGQTSSTIGPGTIDFRPLYDNEPYEDQYKRHARRRMQNKSKFRTPNGFTYSSPMKKSASSGDFHGSFTSEKQKAHVPPGPLVPHNYMHKTFKLGAERNFLTSPPKKAGPGNPARGFNNTDIAYVPDDYDAANKLARSQRRNHVQLVGERRAFVSTCKRTDAFDAHAHCSASTIYSANDPKILKPPRDPLAPLNPRQRVMARAQTAQGTLSLERSAASIMGSTGGSTKGAEDKPPIFRPSSPPKAGTMYSTFTGFPEHMQEPYNEKKVRNACKPDRLLPMADNVGMSASVRDRKPFSPSHGPKSGLMPSTVTKSLYI